jgi:hypothetical protein
MKFLVTSHPEPGATEADFASRVVAEAAASWRMYLDGFIREAYFRTPPDAPGAVLVVEADSAPAVIERLDALPLRRDGLVRFEVTALAPFVPWTALVAADPADADLAPTT